MNTFITVGRTSPRFLLITFSLSAQIFLTNISAQDYAELEWVRKYSVEEKEIYGVKDFKVDEYGNSYVAINEIIYPPNQSHRLDYVVIKYNSSGEQEMIIRYIPSVVDSLNEITKIAVDKLGNIYLAGTSHYYSIYHTVKYDKYGNFQWVVKESSGYMYAMTAQPIGLEIDNSCNVYMASQTGEIYKYNSNGEKIWSIPKDGRHINTIKLFNNEFLYIGLFGFTEKYKLDGTKIWDTKDQLYDTRDLVLDKDGNSYSTGREGITKFSFTGEIEWSIPYEHGFYYFDRITIDQIDYPIVLGIYFDGSLIQYGIIKFNKNGGKLWETFYSGPQNGILDNNTGPADICTDLHNNIYVTGNSFGYDGSLDINCVKFGPGGEQKWEIRYDYPPNEDQSSRAVMVDTAGNVYFTGISPIETASSDLNVLIFKYRQPNFTGINESENIGENGFNLFHNYPNPFNLSTKIKYSVPSKISPLSGGARGGSNVILKIFDVLGREITTLVNEDKSSGNYEVIFDAGKYNLTSGVYICKLCAQELDKSQIGQVKSIKLLLIK